MMNLLYPFEGKGILTMRAPLHVLKRLLVSASVLLLMLLVLGSASAPPGTLHDRVHGFTRPVEFDYVSWSLKAMWGKIADAALGAHHYIGEPQQSRLVLEYTGRVNAVAVLNRELTQIYADPAVSDPYHASQEVRRQLSQQKARLKYLAPLAESILQSQTAAVLKVEGLTLGGQPLPPVLYHTSDVPVGLVVSPRAAIRQADNISLDPSLPLEVREALESAVQSNLDYSALVVPIGGVGVYPTMVMSTSDLVYLTDTVAHEWTHNFLTLRPLGILYDASPAMRIINETTASVAGRELGLEVLRAYYPDRMPRPSVALPAVGPNSPQAQQAFEFRKEMHLTRVTADQLLAEGKIDEAEQYMEQRRAFFWENGYLIRKLNQAYFAFYGAYNDVSQGGDSNGAGGADPVGPAVVAFRDQNPSLALFLRRIGWMASLEQLQRSITHNTTAMVLP